MTCLARDCHTNDVFCQAIYFSTNVLVPYMQEKKTGGSFVTIASTAGIRPRPGLVWYNASKAAVINASKAMAVEYAKDNIRFNTVSGGSVVDSLFGDMLTPALGMPCCRLGHRSHC